MAKSAKATITVDERLKSVAIIMDGNGRWAKRRALPRSAGHVQGAKNVKRVLRVLRDVGVKYVTLYAFSTENWNRPEEEVNGLMELIYRYLSTTVKDYIKKDPDFSMKFLGDKSRLPEKLRKMCIEIEEESKDRPIVCSIALNYGGRDEIVYAANRAIADGHTTLTKEIISQYLYTIGTPDPDLIIRTGGEFRVSNFLLWQSAYSEYYITDTLFPDLDGKEIGKAIESFYSRKRRFGGLNPEDKKEETEE